MHVPYLSQLWQTSVRKQSNHTYKHMLLLIVVASQNQTQQPRTNVLQVLPTTSLVNMFSPILSQAQGMSVIHAHVYTTQSTTNNM